MPLPKYTPCMSIDDNMSESDLINLYFNQGYRNQEIIEFLTLHGIDLSLSTLKRRLRQMNLVRKESCMAQPVSDENLKKAIQKEISGSGCFVGYRKMWSRLRKRGLTVNRERVMNLLRELDPEGVESRRRKRLRRRVYHTEGPNYVWHIDGHDKLKPYGFSIHAGIDGFSRRLLWLEVGPTNKNPDVIAKYYLDAVNQTGGIPHKVRSDDGTENSLTEAIHTYLCSEYRSGGAVGCFNIGRSTANQRIEAYWSHLVKDGPGWWINFFKDLVDLGLYNTADPAYVECVRFCFMDILRMELHEVAELWNQHLISASKFGNSSGPRGKPDCLYFLPHLYNAHECKTLVDSVEINEFIDNASMCVNDVNEDFVEFATVLMSQHNFQRPTNAKEGFDLYLFLTSEITRFST